MIKKVSVLKAVIAVMAVIAVSVGLLELNSLAAQATPTANRSFSADPVDVGGQVTVTITADGYGSFGDVAETLPAGFTYSSSSGLPDDQVTRDGQTVTFAPLGGTPPTTFTYTVTASSMEGDHSFTGVFSGVDTDFEAFTGVQVGGDSNITVAATTTPPDTGDGDTSDGDNGTTSPDAGEPSASRSFSADPVDADGQVTVTITADGYGNFGDVAETLPAGFTYSSSSGLPDDQVTRDGQTVTFALLGGTPPTTFTYTVTASSVEGDHSFTGVFSGVDTDFEAFSGVQVDGESSITVGPPAGPHARRSLSPASVTSGGQVTVTITAEGHGSFGEVAETLPAGFTYSSSSLPEDQVTSVGQTVTLSLIGATSPTTFTYTVRASSVEGDYSFMGVFSGVDAGFNAFSGVQVGGASSIAVRAAPVPTPTTRRPSTGTGSGSGSSGGTSGGGTSGGVSPVATPTPTATPAPTAPAPEPTATPLPTPPPPEPTATPLPTPPPPTPTAAPTIPPPTATPAPAATGVPGERGPAGRQGAVGPSGSRGSSGGAGAAGGSGSQGATGERGSAGPEGPAGPSGPRGDGGSDGAAGAAGAVGAVGDTGPEGAIGNAGPKGDSASGGLGIVALILSIVAIVAVVGAVGALWMGRRF